MSSRLTTPFSQVSHSSSTTYGGRHPVSNDEEMEMAVIAEIEREIYSGMECLEDAFERLHLQAETVRNALRQRGAGLMQNLQNRRRIDVLPNSQTPAHDRFFPYSVAGSDIDGAGSDSEWCADARALDADGFVRVDDGLATGASILSIGAYIFIGFWIYEDRRKRSMSSCI